MARRVTRPDLDGSVKGDDRLVKPLLRDGKTFREITWDEALDIIEKKFKQVRTDHGPDALAFIASSKCTNEESFLMQKLSPQPADNAQAKMLLYFMPIFFTFIMLKLPAGLTLYILVNNLLSIAQQQWLMRRHATPVAAKA